MYVLEEPWAQFTFERDEQHRQAFADHLNATGSDLLVGRPISTHSGGRAAWNPRRRGGPRGASRSHL